VAWVSDPTALPTLGEPGAPGDVATAVHLRQRVMAALTAEGLPVAVDPDGDVAVDVGDQAVFVSVFPTVPPFLRVFGSWLIDAADDELLLLRAANAVTGAINLVKVTVHGDALVVAADLLLPMAGADLADDELAAIVTTTIDAVLGAAQTWHATLTELRG
jgi:hypothetical protein